MNRSFHSLMPVTTRAHARGEKVSTKSAGVLGNVVFKGAEREERAFATIISLRHVISKKGRKRNEKVGDKEYHVFAKPEDTCKDVKNLIRAQFPIIPDHCRIRIVVVAKEIPDGHQIPPECYRRERPVRVIVCLTLTNIVHEDPSASTHE